MNIAIIGYGKMGKEIEQIAQERGHKIVLKITSDNVKEYNFDNLKNVDAAIEFTSPDFAVNNINICLSANTPIVVGTTGWYDRFTEVKQSVIEYEGSLLYATNCSVGVNLFFRLNKYLAQLMNNHKDYEVKIDETHHTQKVDAPSGTAISLAESVIKNLDSKDVWVLGDSHSKNQLSIKAHREENVPGTHNIKYSSEIDDIEIIHTAHSRKGFALGAVLAAEYISNKKGIFTMDDVLFNK